MQIGKLLKMDFAKILEHLAPIAQHFDASMMEYLEVIAAQTSTQHLRAGDRFPLAQHEDHQAAFIVEGVFKVFSTDETGKETIIRLPAEQICIFIPRNIGDLA